jgi:uncharacterized membrane protein
VDDSIIALALIVALVVLAAPFLFGYLIVRTRRELRELRQRHELLEGRLARSEWWVGELARRAVAPPDASSGAPVVDPFAGATAVAAAASSVAQSPVTEATTAAAASSVAQSPVTEATAAAAAMSSLTESAVPEVAALAPAAEVIAARGGASDADPLGPPPPLPVSAPARQKQAFDFENVIGVRLFAWIGGLGLFAGAAFFLQYSIEHALLPPEVRVAVGLLLGSGAVLLGDIMRKRADRAGQAVGGAGVATLYATLFAAHGLYHLVGSGVSFAGMALVTLVAGALATKRHAYLLAVIGLLGGFATPVLLSSGEDQAVALFAYLALLDAGVLFVASARRWGSLSALAATATTLLYAAWGLDHLSAHPPWFALAIAGGLASLFSASRWLFPPLEARASRWNKVADLALAGPFAAAAWVTVELGSDVSLLLLAAFLTLLLLLAWLSARRAALPGVLETSALATVLVLGARVAPDVLGEQLTSTLFTLALPAFALSASLFLSKDAARLAGLRRACGILLGGSTILVALMTELDAQGPVSSYAVFGLAHAAVLLAIALVPGPLTWLLGAQALAVLILATLAAKLTATDHLPLALFIALSLATFAALPVVSPRVRQRAGWFCAGVAPILHFAVLYAFAKGSWPDVLFGFLALLIAGAALALLRFARSRGPSEQLQSVTALFGGVTLLFISAAVPIVLAHEWITLVWACEAVAVAWLYLRVQHRGLLATSAALAAAVLVRLTVNSSLWEYHARSGTIVINWYLYTFGVPALCLFGAAYLLRRDATAQRYRLVNGLWLAGSVLSFVLLNVEIADAYSTGETIGFHLGSSLAEDMTYSLGWVVFALVTLVIGIRIGAGKVRIGALAVLLLAIAKVFLHDLWHLGALYRVGSMMGLAVTLLAVSFLTQKYILRGERP